MRNNKAILDEAARSVRQTFVGSLAGSVVMLGVVGAAGAYGMPEKLTARVLTVAMTQFSAKKPGEPVTPPSAGLTVVAENIVPRAPSPLSPVIEVTPQQPAIVSAPAIRTMSEAMPQPALLAPAMTLPAVGAGVSPASPVAPQPQPQRTEVASLVPVVSDPPPSIAAPVTPPAAVAASELLPMLSTPMVFEAPKAADLQSFAALPKTEVVPPADVNHANTLAVPVPVELPKSVLLRMPIPKPPLTPAQRLDLQGKAYDKAEHCLAQAIYFEARDQAVKGQEAVAQVVLNRVFSPYYPKDVCSVVYQNADHYLSCQFTFACDGKPEAIREFGAWARANRIAKMALAAKVWLPEVAKATHYHASYVHPSWAREMKVMARYGIHTFYRPRNWGDGSNEPAWGAGAVKKIAKALLAKS